MDGGLVDIKGPPVIDFAVGGQNEMLLLSACATISAIFPQSAPGSRAHSGACCCALSIMAFGLTGMIALVMHSRWQK